MNLAANNLRKAYTIVKEHEVFVEGIRDSLGVHKDSVFLASFQDGIHISFMWKDTDELVFRRFPLQMLADACDMGTPEVLVDYYTESTRQVRELAERRRQAQVEAKAEVERRFRWRQFLALKEEFGDGA